MGENKVVSTDALKAIKRTGRNALGQAGGALVIGALNILAADPVSATWAVPLGVLLNGASKFMREKHPTAWFWKLF